MMSVAAAEILPKSRTLALREKLIGKSCPLFYENAPIKITSAAGQYMYDECGKKYLDCINNVAHVGHCHPYVVSEGSKQMKILSTNIRFLHDNIVILAEKITATLPDPLSVLYFVNSGSEAIDLALRLARHYTKSTDTISLDNGYHGHLISALEISPYKLNAAIGIPKASHAHVVPCPDIYRGVYRDCDFPGEDLGEKYADEVLKVTKRLKAEDKQLSCLVIESLQSCGGQIIYPEGYLKRVFEHVRSAGGLCIADEVQVGFGRVGTHMWAFQPQGVVPDIVTMGKPMGNGHPVAAVATTKEVAERFATLGVTYFNTYGGNPVSCAIALAVMDVLEKEELMKNATEVGGFLKTKLTEMKEKHSLIGDVRGIGYFIGIDLVTDRVSREPATEEADTVIHRLKEEGIILSSEGPYGNVLKFKPPMCFNRDDAVLLLEKLDAIFGEIESSQVDRSNRK